MQMRNRILTELSAITVAFVLGIAVLAAILLVLRVDPLQAWRALFETAVTSSSGRTDTILEAVPLVMIAIGYVLAFRARLWAIGGEGQFYSGAIGATAVVFILPPSAPGVTGLLLALAAGIAAGIAWALVPGLLKVRRGVNEVVSCLMLNFVAIHLTALLVRVVFQDPFTRELMSPMFPQRFHLPVIWGVRVHAGVLLALVVLALVYYVVGYSSFGGRVRAVGANPDAAQACGISVHRTSLILFIVCGATAGVAGAVYSLGVTHRLLVELSPGFGYTAIMVALLARNHPGALLPAGVFFAAVGVGGEGMQVELGIPADLIKIFTGVLVLSVVAADALFKRVAWR